MDDDELRRAMSPEEQKAAWERRVAWLAQQSITPAELQAMSEEERRAFVEDFRQAINEILRWGPTARANMEMDEIIGEMCRQGPDMPRLVVALARASGRSDLAERLERRLSGNVEQRRVGAESGSRGAAGRPVRTCSTGRPLAAQDWSIAASGQE
ncbi:MAG: hypothetical protein JOY78_11295 [Pseudonocardia sp.]|nr:hypothetical protein [Pseudonocardia sp.]